MWTDRLRAALAGAVLLLSFVVCRPAAGAPQPAGDVTLDVPFLPQTEDLCGGATAAMLFRYWGDRHASVQQFEPLVDHRAGGIADNVLIDAIRSRNWKAERLNGSVDTLRAEIAAGRPPILLIEDRPQRYHYVVAVGVTDGGVVLHDPTWGPSRTMPFEKLHRAWKPSGYWTLRVMPATGAPRAPEGPDALTASADDAERPRDECDAQLNTALDEIARLGLAHAETVLPALMRSCPASAGPWSELAGIRFSQKRWKEAAALAEGALERDPHNPYAADVLGSSRFMLNDYDAALRAWNIAGKPTLDSVRITGLARTRYSLFVEALDLPTDQLLTADAFRLARRRLEALPDVSSARLALRPDDERFAIADVAVVERATLPRGPIQWAAAGVQAALEREATVNVPGRTGQGESWSLLAGWWERRPRVSLDFAAPFTVGPRGVWRVNATWAVQTYGPAEAERREERVGGAVSLATWLRPNLRVTAETGLDNWQLSDGDRRRTAHVGATIEQRLRNDRLSAMLAAAQYAGTGGAFSTIGASVTMRTSREPRPLVLLARAGASHATADAPFALWTGAGEGRSRGPLLRAHRLLHGGRIDGPVFGRSLVYGTVEAQHWLAHPRLLRVAGAAFVDAASAARRPTFATGAASQVDAGAGLRIRVPGRSGTFRVDYAHGLRDGASTWFVGWNSE